MLHRTKHYWLKDQKEKGTTELRIRPSFFKKTAKEKWSASKVVRTLSKKPQKPITWLDRIDAFLSTPFKRLGVWGWKDTGCEAEAKGVLVRDAAKSSDGFWTLDVQLLHFEIGDRRIEPRPTAQRFIRIEVEPGTHAHAICDRRPPKEGDLVETLAPVVVDKDGPFLELHPDEAFKLSKRPLRTKERTTVAGNGKAGRYARARA